MKGIRACLLMSCSLNMPWGFGRDFCRHMKPRDLPPRHIINPFLGAMRLNEGGFGFWPGSCRALGRLKLRLGSQQLRGKRGVTSGRIRNNIELSAWARPETQTGWAYRVGVRSISLACKANKRTDIARIHQITAELQLCCWLMMRGARSCEMLTAKD